METGIQIATIITGLAVLGALAGVFLGRLAAVARQLIPFSGGLLIAMAALWIAPEIAESLGWAGALASIAGGFVLLFFIDRYVYPVCPSCSHTHDHAHCPTQLHGFAGPILIASALHSLLDGWILAASQRNGHGRVATAVLAGIALHKIPEGLALGVIAARAMSSAIAAVAGCAAAQSMTIAGAALELRMDPSAQTEWAHVLLAVAAGTFLYLGYHAVHSEYKRRGVAPALLPALTAVAGASVVRLFH